VALVLFSDFECPYCASYRTTLEAIKTRFGPKKLQVIWKNNPLRMHPNARPAADVGQAVFESAGPDAFWRYHDLVFTNQKALSPEAPPRWAAEAGVPEERLRQALASSTPASKVEEDLELVRLLGLRGTPMTIVNGFLMEGAQGEGELAELIEEELKRAGGAPAHHACDRMRAGRTTN
jgi:protein-disulfide isomerase